MKKIIIALLILFGTTVFSFAQSSQKISELMAAPEITKGQASYLVASYMQLVKDEASEDEAFDAFKELRFFASNENVSDLIRIDQISLLYMEACKLKGGLFYSITHSKRYAFRELKAKGLIPNQIVGSMTVSGLDAINLLNDCVAKSGGAE